MAKRTKHDEVLAQVRARRNAASKKVYRLEQQGVEIRDSTFDVRKSIPAENLPKMSTRALQRHLKELNGFIDRGTQFVAGQSGVPIPRNVFSAYKAQENALNAKGLEIVNSIGGIKLPGEDRTVADLLNMRNTVRTTSADNLVFGQANRQPYMFTSADDVVTMTNKLKDKNRPGYLQQALKPRLNSLYALLKNSGNEDFIGQVDKLSNAQLLVLLDYSTFASIAQERFSSGDNAIVDREDAAHLARTGHSREDDIRDELQEVFDWAVKVDSGELPVSTGARRPNTNTSPRRGAGSRPRRTSDSSGPNTRRK